MALARKVSSGAAKKRRTKNHALVLASHRILDDGTHVLVAPVFTINYANQQNGNSRLAGILKRKEQTAQRAMVGIHLRLNDVPTHFRGIRIVRLAPSGVGLDTGGLWNALKAPQDAVAEHLGIDDGPHSPASWELDQEYSQAYGVRIELKREREPDPRITASKLLAENILLRHAAGIALESLVRLGCDRLDSAEWHTVSLLRDAIAEGAAND